MKEGIAAGPVRPPYGRRTERTTPDHGEAVITPLEAQSAEPVAPRDRPRRKQPSAPAYARRKRPSKQSASQKPVSAAFTAAREIATRAAKDVRSQFGEGLTREECLKLVNAFRAELVPRRRAGRRPKPHVTAAYLNWKAGMRGVTLYRKHIPGWQKHNRYRRMADQKALMDAIRSRNRRENKSESRPVV
jgi:hypothetical protein